VEIKQNQAKERWMRPIKQKS